MNNRLHNCSNPNQGKFKRVLCVCSAGLLRSPTAAWVLSQPPFNYNTRAAGIVGDFALIKVDDVLLEWADEVVCMEKSHEVELLDMGCTKPIKCLNLPDKFAYRDKKLVKLVAQAYQEAK